MTQANNGPLSGVTVVDLTQFVLGPYATQILGDLGADVIKVEEPSGDRQRRQGKAPNSPTMGPMYLAFGRNKRSVTLDLKGEPGRKALRKLIARADIFIHNMRPDSLARLGFDYPTVKAVKDDIVYVEAMGYSPEGPYAGRQAFDDLIQAASGSFGLEALVDPNAPFRPPASILADKTCGLYTAIASLAALRHREATGEGQYVCVPMLECFTGYIMAEHLYGETFAPPTGGFGHTMTVTPHRRPMRTKDGWLMLQPADRNQAARFMALGGIPDAYESERFVSAPTSKAKVQVYYDMLHEAAATHTTAEWMELTAAHSIPAMAANDARGVLTDPQLAVTLFEWRDLPGEGRYRAMKPPLRFSKTPSEIRRDPPELGADNDEVFAEFGIDAEDAVAS